MKRNKKSLLNAISAMLLTCCNGLLGMISVKFILTYFGSDFNGLNSTASQLVIILILLEGGFTIATNVALFKPYAKHDYDRVNAIISATRNTFRKIGLLSLVFGITISIVYSFFINSDLSQMLVFSVFMMTIFPVCFNFYYATKYRILLQAEQKEYIISAVTLLTTSLGHIVNIIAMPLGCSMWFIRFSTMFFAIINSLVIAWYVNRKFSFINFKAKPDYTAIKGTRDVFAQKLTGVFYATIPIISITLTAGGTLLASVYAVYNSVFILLKGILHAVIDAPRLGFGELSSQEGKEKVWLVYKQYELIISILLFGFIATAAVMIMPFIFLYTKGITDINYNQPFIAIILVLICYFELIHIPSGHMLNMTGNFKVSRNFQIVACGIMCMGIVVSMSLNLGILGVLASVLATAISLCFMEIGYIHTKYFEGKLLMFFRLSVPFFLIAIPLIVLELHFMPTIHSYISFGIIGFIVFVVNIIIGCLTSLLFERKSTLQIYNRIVLAIFKRNKMISS